jgi:myo-inositol-1(or 4)-monophosphatase
VKGFLFLIKVKLIEFYFVGGSCSGFLENKYVALLISRKKFMRFCSGNKMEGFRFMKTILIDALRLSGDLLLELFNKPMDIRYKGSQSSIVTEADVASERMIIGRIRDSFPAHNIISEESGLTDNGSEFTWVIDPLDGTSNFASGIPWFGVMIAVLKNNRPVIGGAYLPVEDKLFLAEAGRGATRNGEPLAVLANRDMKDSLMAFCMDHTLDAAFLSRGIEIYRKLVERSRNIRSTNSLVDFLFVAEGKFGGVINMNTKIWDIAALSLIITEAGGVLKNVGGDDIEFSVDEKIIQEVFPVIAGPAGIIEFLAK